VFVVLLTVRLFAWTVLGSRRHDDSLPGPHQLQQNSQGNVVNGPRRDGAAPGSAIANHCAKDQIPLFHLPVASGAKCLDGSQPAFYYRRSPTAATATKWHVHFEGGGWCWDLPWCNNRADTSYGSSKSYAACLSAASLNQKDIFSTDPALNPPLHDWQTVHVKYCDGTSYTGNAVATYKGRKLFFKGQVNRDATISYLLQQLNMRNATEVVVSGCSAGGLAVYMGLDHIAAMIHAANPRTIVRGLALSGFFADYSALEAVPSLSSSTGGGGGGGASSFRGKADTAASMVSTSSPVLYQTRDDGIVQNVLDYANALRHVYSMANMSAGVHRDCVRSRGVNCVFAKTLAPFLQTPIFSIQPQYDSWQLLHVLSKNFSAQQGQDFGQRLQRDMRQAFAPSAASTAAAATAATAAAAGSRRHGLYIESCAHHCFGCNPDVNEDAWNGAHIRAQLLPLTAATGDAATAAERQPLLSTAASSSSSSSSSQSGGGSSIRTPGPFTPAAAFERWYRWSQAPQPPPPSSSSDGGSPPPLLFLQDAPFPCHDCCRCTAAPLAQSPPSLLSALAAKAIYVLPPELQG
jgi:hypothetical protein